MTALVLLISL